MPGHLYTNKLLRRLGMPVLKALACDISIKNPHAPAQRVSLNSFRHKGYWYHGKNRERLSMGRFAQIIRPGATVIEIGGHIGYITQYFAHLAGPEGKVYVFEPGSNNLPYIRRNTAGLANTVLIEKAVSDAPGTAVLFEEDLTGQNNSLDSDYHYRKNNQNFSFVDTHVTERAVEVVTLDDFCAAAIRPDFIKIDVEGFEVNVLRGMGRVLAARPVMMIEITKNHAEIETLLREAGYALSDDTGTQIPRLADHMGNTFCHPA